jgi:hypothetical protein
MRSRALLFASTLTLALGACATQASSDETAAAPPADAGARCNADAVQSAVGRQATAETVEQARKDAGATTVRTLKPDQPTTMEYLEGRLNLLVDESGAITGARCG